MNPRGRVVSVIERELFANFFDRLEAAGIPALLLRNYENFPAAIGHDLDVFFQRKDVCRATEIFRDVLQSAGGEIIHIHQRDYVFAVWFRAGANEPQAIHLDFYHGAFTWHGLPYVSEMELLAGSRGFGKFRVPRGAHEALNLFLTSLLWGGFFKFRYRERIHSLLQAPEEFAEFSRVLDREFGANAQPPVNFANSNPPDDKALLAYARRMRAAFKTHSLATRPFKSLFRRSRYWWGEFATIVSPPGVCVAFLGPDGSGKSTVIEAVRQRVEYFFGEVEMRHWRPHFLGDAGVVTGRREKNSGPVTDPHGRAAHSTFISTLRFFYYWLDYWLGFPTRVWKFRAKNHLVLFDRYADDIWCDPRRYRLRLPRAFMKWFCRLTPQPDLTFVLLADADVIHRRKGEVPLETLRVLLRNYEALAMKSPRVYAIDASLPVDQIAEIIAARVLRHLKNKLPDRFFPD